MPRGKVIPLERRPRAERVRVVVRGPDDPAEADALRRAFARNLARVAVDLLVAGRLPPPPRAKSGGDR